MSKKISHADQLYEAHRLSSLWLYRANLARERGDTALEERHLGRSQVWLDRLTQLEGRAESE